MSIPSGVFLALREPEDARFYPSVIPVQSYAPPVSARVWLDTSTEPATFKAYNGTAWEAIGTQGPQGDPGAAIAALASGSTVLADRAIGTDGTTVALGNGSSTFTNLPEGRKFVTNDAGDVRWQRDLGMVSVTAHGAVGDGSTDDRAAIQAAVDAAPVGGTVYFPPGTYKILPGSTDATTGWGLGVVVAKRLTLTGPGTLTSPAVFANRCVLIVARSTDVTVQGLSFDNTATASSPYSIGVGMGDTYDTAASGTLGNLRVMECHFDNQWLGVSVQLKDASTMVIDGVIVTDCTVTAKAGVASAGNFNFRTEVPGSIKNVTVGDCLAVNGATASAFNFYGVVGATLSNLSAVANGYAACELENGCQHITVAGLVADQCEVGLWIDDSANITASALTVRMATGTSKRAVSITYGSAGAITTEKIVVNGLTSHLGTVRMQSFGTVLGGGFGLIAVSNATIILDGTNQSSGVFWGARTADLMLSNITVIGASTDSFSGTTNTPGTTRMLGCVSAQTGAEASNGANILGTGALSMSHCSLHGTLTTPTIVTEAQGRRTITSGTGTPESVVTASPGALYLNRNGGTGTSLYVKRTGSATNTGWFAVA